MPLRVGCRGSRLALTQAERVADALRRPGTPTCLVPLATAGDRDRSLWLPGADGRSPFSAALEDALLAGRVDVAVHRPEDLPRCAAGLAVAAVTRRADPRDALCGADRLVPGLRVGTASPHRRAQLLALEPRLDVEPLRGTLDACLRKRRERGLDAVVLPCDALDALGLGAEIGRRLEPDALLPAAGQGALLVQVRAGEEELASPADDEETRRRVDAERRCLELLGAGPDDAVAAHHDGIALTALVADHDGRLLERRGGPDPATVAAALAPFRP